MREQGFDPNGDDGKNAVDTGIVVIGEFGAAGASAPWTVVWRNDTGEVYARPNSSLGPQSRRDPDRLLGRVPTVDYVNDIVEVITRSRGATDWKAHSGVDELARWLRMVTSALDATTASAASALAEGDNAYYLDYGHIRSDVDRSTTELMGRELWEDLDDTAANASRTLSELTEILRGTGNLAQAAAASLRLLELAVGLHVALSEAYEVAHRELPGPQRR
jgi:hypothetical protein